MNLYGLSCILTGITSLSMAIFVYIKGHKYRLARIWSLFALCAAFYGFGAYMVTQAKGASEAFFWWRFAYIGIILLPFLFVYFVYEFLGIRHPFFLKLISALAVILSIANLFSQKLFLNNCTLYFTDMKWVKPIYFIYPPGPLLKFYIIFVFFGLFIYGHLELIKNYSRIKGFKRNQLKYFFFAAALGFAGGGTCFLPCFGINFYPILNFGVPLYFLMISYTIFRYHLMDLKIAITRTGIFVVVYALILGLPFAIALRLKERLINIFGQDWWILPSGLLAILAAVATFIYIYLQRKAENKLLKEQRRYHEILREAAGGMTRIRNLQKLLNLIVQVIAKNVRISYSAIYLFDEKTGEFLLKTGYNLKKDQPNSIVKENPLISWLEDNKELLVYEEIKRGSEDNPDSALKQLEEQMRFLNAAVIIPSFLEGRLLSLLMLGDKLSAGIYSLEDLNIFSILGNQIAVAIENASLYQNIEEQVRERTKELVEVQKQLIQAEKLATMGTLAGGVAHEINNPLTAILTNVQILLSEDNIRDAESKESLQLIEEATSRCRSIVQKLMAYAKKPLEPAQTAKVDLSKVIQNVVLFLDFQLEQEDVKIITKAEQSDYFVTGNQNELEQVVTNIVLNARDAIKQIKKSGNIYITLSKTADSVNIVIKDEGAGIPKEIIPKIFDPFFTTKDVGKGTGLGLSICQAIVEKHNGIIKVQSEASKGTLFTIQLPKARQESKIKSIAGL